MNEALIEISNISKIFGKTCALNAVSATLTQGRIIGLVGPDGAGKTTLMRILAGLMLPSSGEVRVLKEDLLIGYMPQKFGLYEDLTVKQNLDLYADLKGVSKEERQEVFQTLLHFTQLAPFESRLANDLSGGMKQKLGLACALLKKPTILLLDEPSVGVDPLSRRELWSMVQKLLGEGICVVWSTAYLDEAEKCDEVILLNEGKLLFCGAPTELTQRVQDRAFLIFAEDKRHLLTTLIQKEEVLDGVIQGRELRIILKHRHEDSLLKGYQVEPAEPRFEDGFIDILGGAPKGKSKLAESFNVTNHVGEDVIIANSLTKQFGQFTAVNHLSFEVKRGEIFGLLGPNGAGKSTTFKMLCGLLTSTGGSAKVCGFDLKVAPSQAREQLGYMAQKFSLYGELTIRQNLDFFSGAYNLTGKIKRRAIDEMIEIFALEKYLEMPTKLLPLGVKQRLSLAAATIHYPPILFLDEPTSGVDPIIRREFWGHINGLVEKGVTILITTHFMDEAEYCDRIALVYRGEIIHLDQPSVLKNLAKTNEQPNPTLEESFIYLIEQHDANEIKVINY